MSSSTTLINSLLENLFNYESQKTNLHHNGNTESAPNEVDDSYQFPKRQTCNKMLQSQSNKQLDLSNR